jgi:hypothetical protein
MRNRLKEERFILAYVMVSEVSVCGQLMLLQKHAAKAETWKKGLLRGALHIKTRKVAGKLGTCMLSMHFYH